MSLPFSRNTNYVDGSSVVNAVDLNAIQDAIIGMKHGPITLPVPNFVARLQASGALGTLGAAFWPNPGASTPDLVVPLHWVPGGKRILGVSAIIQDSATGPTKLAIGLISAVGVSAWGLVTGLGTASAGNGTTQVISSPALTETVPILGVAGVASKAYGIYITTTTGTQTCVVGNLFVTIDAP